MSKLRGNPQKHTCQQELGLEAHTGKDRGICGGEAEYRCNACKLYFCDDCWWDHLEMTIEEVKP